ncbi:MAG: hypothetical protein C0453_15700, partial [Comamonadaceae bacterium]|nr:hypothetical protein [Comamonadaceae bacterium]
MFRFRCVHSVAVVALAWGFGPAASVDALANGSASKTRPAPSARAPAFFYQQHNGAMAFAD